MKQRPFVLKLPVLDLSQLGSIFKTKKTLPSRTASGLTNKSNDACNGQSQNQHALVLKIVLLQDCSPVAMGVLINYPKVLARIDVAKLKRQSDILVAAAGCKGWELSVLLTGDKAIQALNKNFRQLDEPTDILAFPFHENLVAGQVYEWCWWCRCHRVFSAVDCS